MEPTSSPRPYAFPLVLPAHPVKRWVRCTLGDLVSRMRPGLKDRLQAGAQPKDRWERLALQALVNGLERRGDTEGIARLQQHYWSAADVVGYHEIVDSRFDTMFLGAHKAIVERLVDAARDAGAHTLCEIGCGSGRVLAHFAAHAPAIDRFIGVDLSPQQVAVNAQRYTDPRITFVADDALAWIDAHGGDRWSFLSYGGVLEYIPQQRLADFLCTVAQRSPAVFGIVEPLAKDFDPDAERTSRHYGAERSLSHPYPAMFTQAGFSVLWREEAEVEGHRFLMLVARA
jgi:SAM-dependent methyltransferase